MTKWVEVTPFLDYIIIVYVMVIADHSLLICLQRRWLEFTAQNSLMCEKAFEQIKEKAYPYVSTLHILGLVPVEYWPECMDKINHVDSHLLLHVHIFP